MQIVAFGQFIVQFEHAIVWFQKKMEKGMQIVVWKISVLTWKNNLCSLVKVYSTDFNFNLKKVSEEMNSASTRESAHGHS